MKKNHKMMLLLVTLIAIISCSSGGGGGSSSSGGSGNPNPSATVPGSPATPSNPGIPTISNSARFQKTNLSVIPDASLDIFAYKIAGEKVDRTKIASKTHYDVGNREVGFFLNRSASNVLDFVAPATMNVKAGGGAITFFEGNSVYGGNTYFLSNPKAAVNHYFTRLMHNADKLTINLEPNSYLFILKGVDVELSKTNISDIISGTPANQRPTINGTGYKLFKFDNSRLRVDQNVNLDDPNDLYNKVEVTNSTFTINSGVTLTGTKDNQIGIKGLYGFEYEFVANDLTTIVELLI